MLLSSEEHVGKLPRRLGQLVTPWILMHASRPCDNAAKYLAEITSPDHLIFAINLGGSRV